MITLQPINETNFMEAASLKVSEKQRAFVASAPMVLARAYAYRGQNAICWGIYNEAQIVGLAMLHDMDDEPACYHLCDFLIDVKHQNNGIGQKALKLVLDHCRREGRHGEQPDHGPSGLWRCGIRKDGGSRSRRFQGSLRFQAGGRAGAHHRACLPALPDVHLAPERTSGACGIPLACP